MQGKMFSLSTPPAPLSSETAPETSAGPEEILTSPPGPASARNEPPRSPLEECPALMFTVPPEGPPDPPIM